MGVIKEYPNGAAISIDERGKYSIFPETDNIYDKVYSFRIGTDRNLFVTKIGKLYGLYHYKNGEMFTPIFEDIGTRIENGFVTAKLQGNEIKINLK